MTGFDPKQNNSNLSKNSLPTNLTEEKIIELAVTAHSEGRLSEASKYYQHYIDQGFNDAKVYSNYGVILKDLGKLNEAELSTKKAIELKPDYADAYANLGMTFIYKSEHDLAIKCFSK